MNVAGPAVHHAGHDVGERARGHDRPLSRAPRTIARATAREWRSSPNMKMMSARSLSQRSATTSAAHGPARAHAHVERAVEAERKAALGLSSCMEETPRSSTTPSAEFDPEVARDAIEAGEFAVAPTSAARRQPRPGPAPRRPRVGSRSMPMTAVSGRREDRRAHSRRRRRCRRYRRRRLGRSELRDDRVAASTGMWRAGPPATSARPPSPPVIAAIPANFSREHHVRAGCAPPAPARPGFQGAADAASPRHCPPWPTPCNQRKI